MKAREQTQVLTATTATITNTLPGEMKALQDGDQMLKSYKTKAVEGTTKHTKDGEVSFVRRKGVLYRLVEKGEEKFKQLLVPKTRRAGEYELSAVKEEEERVLGTINGTVADSPWTIPAMVKEWLGDNTRQQRFGRKWIDKPASCCRYALPVPK